MGGEKVTVKNLQIVEIEPETGLVDISGPVPGSTGGLLEITRLKKGELTGIQEIQAQVVEGEAPAEEAKEGQPPQAEVEPTQAKPKEAQVGEGGQNEQS
jgi:hypothetical protein